METTFTEQLLASRQSRSLVLPVKTKVYEFADNLLGILFPHFSEEVYFTPEEIGARLNLLERNLKQILNPLQCQMSKPIEEASKVFFAGIPAVYDKLWYDAQSILEGDPAAESVDEVVSAYPGFFAISIYRLAHELYLLDVPILPRILTEYAHQKTGIDIHPGARIGKGFFIDHGTGIVIGETTLIGNHVKVYQGVTLGALSVEKSLSISKRHPTIEDNVVLYSNATILGGSTTIGHDSVIGGNVWLTETVPPFSLVYHKSEIRVRDTREKSPVIDFVI